MSRGASSDRSRGGQPGRVIGAQVPQHWARSSLDMAHGTIQPMEIDRHAGPPLAPPLSESPDSPAVSVSCPAVSAQLSVSAPNVRVPPVNVCEPCATLPPAWAHSTPETFRSRSRVSAPDPDDIVMLSTEQGAALSSAMACVAARVALSPVVEPLALPQRRVDNESPASRARSASSPRRRSAPARSAG